MREIEKYDISQATHKLYCRHCVGRNSCYDYSMKCIPLGYSKKNGKLKIVVFGDRAFRDKGHIKHIRYVEEDRVKLL